MGRDRLASRRKKPATYANRAENYARNVVAGNVVACKWVKAACQRHLDDLKRKDISFDDEAANRVCRFAEAMPHTKGEWARRGEKIRLEDWQVFVLACVFGWKRPDGLRRFRTMYLEVSRKNAKSTLLAVIALYLLACDGESGAEVYSAATTRDQAKIVFSAAKSMASKEPEFRNHFGIACWKDSVTVEASDSFLKALSAEANTLDGLSPHGAIVDELHAHRTREVWDVLETGTGARSQPILAAITTAGSNRSGICYEIRGYLTRILNTTLHAHEGMGYKVEGDSAVDDTFFGMIYTLDDTDDWQDETCWIKSNPNLGVSVYLDDLRRQAHKAAHVASAQPNYLTKRHNIWVNADSAWMDMLAWDRASADIDFEDYQDWSWTFGLDLASKKDVASLAMIAQRGKELRLFTRHWLPEDAIEDSTVAQYRGWESTGYISSTPGNVIDHDAIIADIEELAGKLHPRAIAYDPGFDTMIPQNLNNRGYPMVEVRPTVMNFSEPMKQLEADVLCGSLKHDGNPVMTWMISNVVCHRDAKDNIYPRKQSDENKIDGVIAAILARGQSMAADTSSLTYLT